MNIANLIQGAAGLANAVSSPVIKYDYSGQENATKKFNDAVDKYSGKSGYSLANTLATNASANLAGVAGQNAMQNAQSVNASKGMAMAQANGAGSQSALNGYSTLQNQALGNNDKAITSAQSVLSNATALDKTKYEAQKNALDQQLQIVKALGTAALSFV